MNPRITTILFLLALMCLVGCSADGSQAVLDPGGQAPSPYGSMCAARLGETIIIEVALGGIPEKDRVLALGLRLPDGTAIAPCAIHVLREPSGELAGSPLARFDFEGLSPAPPGVKPSLCFQVHFDLAEVPGPADDAVFSIALGRPDSRSGNRMGVRVGIDTRDGSPCCMDSGPEPTTAVAVGEMPTPPEICRHVAPSVGFHLGATSDACGDGSMVAFVPRLNVPSAPDSPASLGSVAVRKPLRK